MHSNCRRTHADLKNDGCAYKIVCRSTSLSEAHVQLDPIQGCVEREIALNQRDGGISCDPNCVVHAGVKLPRGHDWLPHW